MTNLTMVGLSKLDLMHHLEVGAYFASFILFTSLNTCEILETY